MLFRGVARQQHRSQGQYREGHPQDPVHALVDARPYFLDVRLAVVVGRTYLFYFQFEVSVLDAINAGFRFRLGNQQLQIPLFTVTPFGTTRFEEVSEWISLSVKIMWLVVGTV
jgi:hypothetical protein